VQITVEVATGEHQKHGTRQEAHLVDLLHSGEYTTAALGDLFGVARSTVYRAVVRSKTAGAVRAAATSSRPASRPVLDGVKTTSPDTYRPRHGAPNDIPSENRAQPRARAMRPAKAPQPGR
jgi:hypothetical protein